MHLQIESVERRILLAITATYSAAAQQLTVTGDALNNTITVSRNAGGTILVNGGAVAIGGGVPTVANTALIIVNGLDGDDTITLDETNGALPASQLNGGNNNDVLTGGAGPDAIDGGAGNDTALGRGGIDTLLGGAGNDVLTGGDADDQAFGEGDNDRMIWNPGDDTDLNEGGDGTDTVEINGGGGAEVFTAGPNGARVRFDRVSPAPFAIDIGTSESLVLNGNAGDDAFSTTGALAGIIHLTIDGGANNDSINGSNGIDVLLGGDGNDFIDGNAGADTAFMGAGDDLFQWDPGDGSDVVEGQDGVDTMRFNGSGGAELFDVTRNGGRVIFFRNVGTIAMDLDDIETIDLNALGGADIATVNDVTGTDLTAVNVDLAAAIGGGAGDGVGDAVVVNFPGTNTGAIVTDTAAGTEVTGGAATVRVAHADATLDSLLLNTNAGSDLTTVNQLGAPGTVRRVLVDGGADDDTLNVVSTAPDGTVVVLSSAGSETVNVNTDGVGNANAAFEATQRIAALSIGSGGVARLVAGGEKVLTASALDLTGTAQLDLTDNNLILDYTGASPATLFRTRLLSGFAGGAWTGPGIISATAQTVTNSGVGLAEATDLFTVFPATFKGQSVDNTTLLLAHCLYGDADLSGNVNLGDFNRLAGNFGGSNKRWAQGDFNYDGNANLQDFNRQASNWGLSGAPAAGSRDNARPDTETIADDLLA